MNVTLTGATGFIGRPLVKSLIKRGDRVTILSRSPKSGTNPRYMSWDAQSAPPAEAMNADAIIHLAGESVAQPWSGEAKHAIWSSRVDGTRMLVDGIAAAETKPRVLISASAIGIYGDRGSEVLTESSKPGSGFLEDVCVEWEHESQRAADFGVRVVNPRIGLVIGRGGGALSRMLKPFKLGIGGKLGLGTQWMSWIHVSDVAGLILFALDHDKISGPVNATAPMPVTNIEFTRDLGIALGLPAVLTIPRFALKVLYGEMSHIILASQRVIPKVARNAGYAFRFVELGHALEFTLRR